MRKHINISSHHANGEIGFLKNTVVMTVIEPDGNETNNVALHLTRDGTSERIMVDWIIEGQDSSVSPAIDVKPISGTVILEIGKLLI